ncbi:hypothetical protein F2Q68_00011679 [Brassica cretica]|uniref:Prohibitin n=1 Tax=Brassica cretica TaxID=69181 RepID=A0A8S9L5V0_BRACR|nr:hypothetical protein F2Q68_00011679 [Brassica cretica]
MWPSTNMSYGMEFSRAVEAKQVAQQEDIEELRRIEASWDVAAALARSPNVAYLPGRKSMFLNLNVGC